MESVSFRIVEQSEFPVFRQYLLPDAARLLVEDRPGMLALGAVCGTAAGGAAALRFETQEDGTCVADLVSLYLDPLLRRRGVGSAFLGYVAEQAAARGADELYAQYIAEPETMEALDALFRKAGGEPAFHLPIYEIDSARFHESRLLKAAFSPDYRRPAHIVPFSALRPEQLEELEADPELQWFVDPARRLSMRPEFSLAYLVDDRVAGFWLGSTSAVDRYSVQGVWHNSQVPPSCFHELIHAHVNLCWYYGGGDFLYYVSPAVEFAESLIQKYTGGDCKRLEEHSVTLPLKARAAQSPAAGPDEASRFVAQPEDVQVLREEDMICASCRHRMGLASECGEYEVKPRAVMLGESECPDYNGEAPERTDAGEN